MYQFKAKDSEINLFLFCLDDISKDFTVDKMKKLDYADICVKLLNFDGPLDTKLSSLNNQLFQVKTKLIDLNSTKTY